MPHRATPATVYPARPTANLGTRTDTHDRVRTDRVDQAGSITLRVAGRMPTRTTVSPLRAGEGQLPWGAVCTEHTRPDGTAYRRD
jgi:hypothetical protein